MPFIGSFVDDNWCVEWSAEERTEGGRQRCCNEHDVLASVVGARYRRAVEIIVPKIARE
jgi:hypothetical protein